jgi:hypothetical protein
LEVLLRVLPQRREFKTDHERERWFENEGMLDEIKEYRHMHQYDTFNQREEAEIDWQQVISEFIKVQ